MGWVAVLPELFHMSYIRWTNGQLYKEIICILALIEGTYLFLGPLITETNANTKEIWPAWHPIELPEDEEEIASENGSENETDVADYVEPEENNLKSKNISYGQ